MNEARTSRRQLLALAAAPLALALLDASADARAEPWPEEQVRMFASHYHGSIEGFFTVVGHDFMDLPMEQFEALPDERRRAACSVIVDYMTFRSVTLLSILAAYETDAIVELIDRAARAARFEIAEVNEKFARLGSKSRHCMSEGSGPDVPFQLTRTYAATVQEFALRDLYAAQAPFIRWAWRAVPDGQEKEAMKVLITSMERKYLLRISDEPGLPEEVVPGLEPPAPQIHTQDADRVPREHLASVGRLRSAKGGQPAIH